MQFARKSQAYLVKHEGRCYKTVAALKSLTKETVAHRMTVQSGTKNVILVDDDLEVHDLISAYLKPRGFGVICFKDAESALQASLTSEESWDVLLTDFHFPNLSGAEFTLQMKQNLPDLPVILITPADSSDTAIEAISKGAYDFIALPIQYPQLLVAVERALRLHELVNDLSDLQDLVKTNIIPNKLIGRSLEFLKAKDIAKRVANSSANIFILGESGTGKELFTKFIHDESMRSKGPFVAINCSAIPEALLESELFGHAKGAFTGALAKKIGLFEEAQNGTLFLDEIGDLSLPLQAKLLRVIQDKNIKRVGENQYRPINCRIICATHKDLSIEVQENRFREDLYFRLNVIAITIPSLRERQEDILLLANFFLRKFALENGSKVKSLSKDAIEFLIKNPWRGNVRELENSMERAVILCTKTEISLDDFPPISAGLGLKNHIDERQTAPALENTFSISHSEVLPSLTEVIKRYIEYAVEKNGGAQDKTAKDIGIDRKTLYKRMSLDKSLIQ